jgi:hypothetical protein
MPVSVTKTVEASASTHSWIPLNVYEPDALTRISVTAPKDLEAKVEYTLDNPLSVASAAAITLMTINGSAGTFSTAVGSPVYAVRLNVTAASGGTPVFRVLQSGR